MNDSGSMRRHDQVPNRATTYARLASDGTVPHLPTFVKQHPDLTLAELAEIVRIDQRIRWESGDPSKTEDYVAEFPQLADDLDGIADIAYSEYLLRKRYDNSLDSHLFVARFPTVADTLRAQIEFHHVCESIPTLETHADDSSVKSDTASQLEPPQQLGRYVIERRLGTGGMGSVYLAHDTVLGRRVAIKRPRMEVDNQQLLQRFYREARMAARLSHPHVCAVYDAGEIDGVHYLAMAYIEGESLADYLARHQRLSIDLAVRWVRQIALAMAESHRMGVLHRDLKPANIMIDAQQGPIVTDFGLARCDELDIQRFTTKPTLFGTIAYAAPEQLTDGLEAGAAADIYSLGVVLYELLTGRPPFSGSVGNVIRDVVSQMPIPPSTLNREVPQSLENVCLRAMHKDPLGRWESMTAFAEALDNCLPSKIGHPAVGDERSMSPVDAPSKTNVRRFSRRTTIIALLGTVLATMVGSILWKSNGRFGLAPVATKANSESTRRNEAAAANSTTGQLPRTVEDPKRPARGDEGNTIQLWNQVLPRNLADGALTDLAVDHDQLTFNASGASSQLWLNYPQALSLPIRFRTGIHIDSARGDGFVKIVSRSSQGELSAMLWPSHGELRAGIFNSSSERLPQSYVAVAKLSETIDVDIDFSINHDRQVLSVDGHPQIERRLPFPSDGSLALVVAGWKVRFRQPRAVVNQPSDQRGQTEK